MYGFIIALAAAWVPSTVLYEGHSEKVYLEANAPRVRDFALKIFDDLDRYHAGIITRENLQSVERDAGRFTEDERHLARLLRLQIDLAGHVVDSYTAEVPVTATVSCGEGCTTEVVNKVRVTVYANDYVISREDLAAFPERVHRRWERW